MKTLALPSALQGIQELIARETGKQLDEAASYELEQLLSDAAALYAGVSPDQQFASRDVTVLLTDLRGFTSISESFPATVLLEILNRYLIRMSEIAIANGGTIDKFMGDAIMVLFGAPSSHVNDVENAITCAVEMQIALFEINQYHKQIGMPELNMGVGINTGSVMAGLLGSKIYSEYTVIGDEVNLTSRIEAYSLRGQVLISQSTFERCKNFVDIAEPMEVYVKGKKQPVVLYEVLGIPSLGKVLPRQEIRKSPRVEVNIPFTYHTVDGKIISEDKFQGTLLDLSYNGVLAEVDRDFPARTDIKLDMNLSVAGTTATDIYAKILRTFEKEGRKVASIEFTSVSVQSNLNIRHFVQLLIQGGTTR